jgi:hypothetical protein
MSIVGFDHDNPAIDVEPDTLRALKLYVTVSSADKARLAGSATPFRFVVTDRGDGQTTVRGTTFRSSGE